MTVNLSIKKHLQHSLIIATASLIAFNNCIAQTTSSTNTQLTNSAAAIDYSNWYQVEVIIFSRGTAAYTSEAWPKNIALAYPLNIRYLIDPNASTPSAVPATTSDNFNRESDQAGSINSDSSLASAQNNIDFTQTPFVILPENQNQLTRKASNIKRKRGYKLLFHKSWRQPVNDKDEAVAIVVEGGNQFADHYELEGALTISLSRYLHAHTNLWLTTFESNYGQDSYHWPNLPSKPTDIHFQQEMQEQLTSELQTTHSTASVNSARTETKWGNTYPTNNQDQERSPYSFDSAELLGEDTYNFTQNPYVIRKIATLKQRRKMRSGELHYIDHPLMGILIKIDPYAPNTEEQ